MSAIRDLVMAEPLFETHAHQNRFDHHPWDTKSFEEFIQYGTADLHTSSRVNWEELSRDKRIHEFWPFVRTTGYGQAAEMACRELFGLEYTADNAKVISTKVQEYIQSRTHETVFRDLYAHANIQWSVTDMCWDTITDMDAMGGNEHLGLFRFALRHDALLVPSSQEDLKAAEKALGCSLDSVEDLNNALDSYTERALAKGRLAALKIGLAYRRALDFGTPLKDDASRAFDAIRQGTSGDTKGLHDYLFDQTIARAQRLSLPVQIHTGYLAGNWSDITRGDPSGLIPTFQRYKDVQFDLFHASWPYAGMAMAIGKQFPNVWVDMCWMWAMNPVEAERILDEWLGAVPNNKIFAFGSDTGSPFGTLGYALQARKGIANVLERKVARGEYDESTAAFVAKRIMSQNALDLYGAG